MAPQSPAETKKLVVFVTIVVAALAIILSANIAIRSRTSAFAEGAGTPRRAGLERLWANPTKCAMTMEPSPDNERPMRHVNAGIIGKVDVLELGQSDADHMSNSYFVYHYEVFEDVVAAHGAPALVLYDVGSGYILRDAMEPAWDTPGQSALWWGFPPFHTGKPDPLPWYRDLPSLLSLAQTQLTLTWVEHQLPHRTLAPVAGDTEDDNGQQFRCVDVRNKSGMYRWLADGSRVYAGELDGVLAKPGAVHVTGAVGDRHINESRLVQLDWVLGKIVAAGTKVIVYTPPVHPAVFADKKQAPLIEGAEAAIRAVVERHGLDYCGLALDADSLGCGNGDFSDELHISRKCNQRIVKRLATGCAPHAGAMLKDMLTPATLE